MFPRGQAWVKSLVLTHWITLWKLLYFLRAIGSIKKHKTKTNLIGAHECPKQLTIQRPRIKIIKGTCA